MATVDLDRIIQYEKAGLLRVQKHPDRPLFIANYSERVQFDRLWDDLTLMCRGLIFDTDGTIIARPFRKFFNLGEPGWETPPDEPFEVTEKLDGSLGILYWLDDTPYIATRGSFTSEQALHGTEILHRYPLQWLMKQSRTVTFLFEILYPENRIVVSYGDREELVLLAGIDTETGIENAMTDAMREQCIFPVVKKFEGVEGIEDLMRQYEGEDNFEGFVLRFTTSGTRLKVKLPEYVRLHRLRSGVNARRIWEILSAHQSLDPFLDRVPDEFSSWVIAERDRLQRRHRSMTGAAMVAFSKAKAHAVTVVGVHDMSIAGSIGAAREYRKAFAEEATKHPTISGLLFTLLDGGDIEPLVWRMIRPEAATPFAPTGE